MARKTAKVRKVCAHCGSEDVTHDALARWDHETQQWEISSTLDNADCERCGGECTTEDAPLDYDPWKIPRELDRVIVRYDGDDHLFEVYHYAPWVEYGEAELLERFAILQNANQAAKDFAANFDDSLVVLEGEDYP